jgi:beta-barrel assembly-enhancing protease
MKPIRIILLVLLLGSGVALIFFLGVGRIKTPLGSSFAPAFQILGVAPKTINSTLSRLLPVNELDEKEFGESLALEYDKHADPSDPMFAGLNSLMKEISVFAKKPFTYRVYIEDWNAANAFALPGGIIVVTRGLFSLLQTDSEKAAILAHEMGHIELGHCFDSVRSELLAKKGGSMRFVELVSAALGFLLRHSYSKYEENQADDYAFELLVASEYDPGGLASLFQILESVSSPAPERANIVRDYFSSHPPLSIRKEKYEELAIQWKKSHPNETRKQ